MEASWIAPLKSNGCHAAVDALSAFRWKPWSALLHVSCDQVLEITCRGFKTEENPNSVKWREGWKGQSLGVAAGEGNSLLILFLNQKQHRQYDTVVWLREPPTPPHSTPHPPTLSVICPAKTAFTTKALVLLHEALTF